MSEDNETMNDGSVDENAPKFQIPLWVILFLLVIVVLDVGCMIKFPNILSQYKVYKTAESRTKNGETLLAVNELNALVEEHPNSIPIITKSIELSMESGYYDSAGYLYDTYLTGKSLSNSEYSKMDGYYMRLEKYYATYDAIEQIFSKEPNGETTDEINYEELKSNLRALLEENGQDYAYVNYYLGLIETDVETAKDYMQKCYDIDPEIFDTRVQLGVMYRSLGDYEKAKQYNEKALIKESSDSGALRSMAILYMLEGDLESGLKFAQDAYNSNSEGAYVRETYLIALTMNGKKAEAKMLQDEIIKINGTLDDDTIKLLEGEITLEDYYVKG